VYGAPIVAYPGWYPVPGILRDGIGLSFGIGVVYKMRDTPVTRSVR
jgi:hypothetical protein